MHDFRVELQGIDAFLYIRNRTIMRIAATSQFHKALRDLLHLISVAHPHDRILFNILKKRIVVVRCNKRALQGFLQGFCINL